MTESSRRQMLKSGAALGVISALGSLLGGADASAQETGINAMGPTPEQMQQFLALPENPVVMVNLLKFKPDGGAEAYARYGAAVTPLLEKVGGKSLFAGRAAMCLVGDAEWDMVALAQYPKPQALIEMVSSPEYQAIHHHREEGLIGQVNYAVWKS